MQRFRDCEVDLKSGSFPVRRRGRLGYLSAAPRVSTRVDAEAGGPRAHVLGVITAFESLGWKVFPFIVGNRMPDRVVRQSEMDLGRSRLIRLVADVVRLGMGIVNSLRAWRELNNNVDWVYERLAVLQALGWIFKLRSVPWILETSGLFFYEAKNERKAILLSGIARWIEIWSYRHCDVIVCVTRTLKDLIVKASGVPEDKIVVVPNGVDIDRFDPAFCSPRRIFTGPTIGFIGTLASWNRLDILLRVLSELRLEGISYSLTVVGDGPMRHTWEALAGELGLNECVLFIGRVSWDEVPSCISGFDLGYMGNHRMEIGVMYHSPLKLYEYMAMAKPVVASKSDDALEMVIPGVTGFLFESGDPDNLKSALRAAHLARPRWGKMGSTARDWVREKGTWAARVASMIPDIERILENGNADSSAGR
ncbi:MAG: glycosyltransferase [Chloroflexi bacterium]|nr:glycosyltransferase [Chloroflexota bacterium]